MIVLWISLAIIILCVLVVLSVAYISFRKAFLRRKDKGEKEEYPTPRGEAFDPYRPQLVDWIKEARTMITERVSIKSFDGLTLRGKYYEYQKGAPLEIMFHGYRGDSERDLCGGVQRCFRLRRNALIVDQRGGGESEGKVITFGINESKDCVRWANFAVDKFGKDIKIILTGISMGAATVLMATGRELPDNVVCVLADCGYSSPEQIIKKVVADMNYPADFLYPFVKLGARLFGGFNIEETSGLEAMKRCNIPVIFIHGEQDDYVPCDMSREMYKACNAPKVLVTVPDAGHGLAYLKDREGYFKALMEFADKHNIC